MGDDGVSSGAAILKALEEKQDISWLNKYEMPYFGTEIYENDVVEFCKNDNRVTYTNLKDAVCKHAAVSLKKKMYYCYCKW